MKGKTLPSYILRRKRDGVLLFRKRYAGKIVEIRLETQFAEGEPIPFALHQERERLLSDPAPVAPGRTLAAAIRKYVASVKYRGLAPRTQSDYDKRLEYIKGKLGHLEPRHIERRHVISWLDKWSKADGPHEANYRLRVLRIVLERCIDYGLLKVGQNPAASVSEIKYDKKESQPWPDTAVKDFRGEYGYDTRERLLFELLIGTGQRIGDALAMSWSHICGDSISVRQNKTKKRLEIPLTSELKEALRHAKRDGLTILTADGKTTPWKYRGAAHAMKKAREAIGAQQFDNHGLRYTAAVELCLAGCDDDQIAAVTGQSASMVAHYTASVRQKVRAQQANVLRMERNENRT